ncbi:MULTISPECIES: IS66 family insertion sequence element accessory protein TnpB [unclassified Pseudomonas]|uniref:IS66 family insertion sequence element accessory protein TnpB n=1 Tax=unclassified Pseudomonas TaxID=196821 RepID=UPI00117B936A
MPPTSSLDPLRKKAPIHDGLGICLTGRRLHRGKFTWLGPRHGSQMKLSTELLHTLIPGSP